MTFNYVFVWHNNRITLTVFKFCDNMQLPKRVTIELTNRCNRACAGCPRHQMRYPLGDMNETLFKTILKQLPGETTVVPFFRGEPTLHPKFSDLLPELHRFSNVQLATNGDYLTHENKRAILENVTFLSVSLHKFQLPVETAWLPFLHEARDRGLNTQISIVEPELPQKWRGHFTREWLKHADRVRIYEMHSKNGFGSLTKKSCVEPCRKPFEEMVVYWDGKVGLCNHDWNASSLIADLNKQSIEEVWNSQVYKSIRFHHELGWRKNVEACKNCDFQSNKITGELILAHN